jgi:hypothetical protein
VVLTKFIFKATYQEMKDECTFNKVGDFMLANQSIISILTKCAESAQEESDQERKEYAEQTGEELNPSILIYLTKKGQVGWLWEGYQLSDYDLILKIGLNELTGDLSEIDARITDFLQPTQPIDELFVKL